MTVKIIAPSRKTVLCLCGVALPFFAAILLVLGAPRPAAAQTDQQAGDPIILAAGDIAKCNRNQDEMTGALLDILPGTILGIGDNAYEAGSLQEFNDCYGPSWGRHKDRVYPVPGNHEYLTGGAEGYFTYFGDRATPLEPGCRKECKGYYSFDVGTWHIVALNSEIANDPGSAQEQWLRADLAAHPNVCTLAYWHKPRFSSGHHGGGTGIGLFNALYDYGADIVLSGHDHDYERFAPQDTSGNLAPDRGVRQFVVGTGGDSFRDWSFYQPNSEARADNTWGVLKLTLHPTSYDWEFVPIAGQTWTDKGSAPCVTISNPPAAPAGAQVVNVSTTAPADNTAAGVTTEAATTNTAASTAAATLPAEGLDYVVKAGDTLSLIAMRYGLDWQEVARVNQMTNTEVIEVGQVIRLPGVTQSSAVTPTTQLASGGAAAVASTAATTSTTGTSPSKDWSGSTRYIVKPGDTLFGIALSNNISLQDLLEANDMTNADLIQIGQELILPGVPATASTSTLTATNTLTTGASTVTSTGIVTGTSSVAATGVQTTASSAGNAGVAAGSSLLPLPTPTPRPITANTVATATTGTASAGNVPATHTVASGDTMISIALKYNLDWQQLLKLNNMGPDSILQIGQQIKLK